MNQRVTLETIDKGGALQELREKLKEIEKDFIDRKHLPGKRELTFKITIVADKETNRPIVSWACGKKVPAECGSEYAENDGKQLTLFDEPAAAAAGN